MEKWKRSRSVGNLCDRSGVLRLENAIFEGTVSFFNPGSLRSWLVAIGLVASISACGGSTPPVGSIPKPTFDSPMVLSSRVAAVAKDASYLYVADGNANAVVRSPLAHERAGSPDSVLYLASNGVTRVYATFVDSNGRLYVGAQTDANGKVRDKILEFAAGSGGGAFPLRTIEAAAPPRSIAVDDRGFVYAAAGSGRAYVYPPSDSMLPVRRLGEGVRSIALDARGALYALVRSAGASGIDVYDSV